MHVESHGPSRRSVLKGGLTVAAMGAAQAWAPSAAAGSRGPYIPYSSNSFFRSRVAGAPVDQTATTAFRRFMHSHPDQRAWPHPRINGLDGNEWGTAWALGLWRHPVWRLTGNVPSEVAVLRTEGFRAPEWFGDLLTGTSDSPFVVLDRPNRRSLWANDAKLVGERTISVGAAGAFSHDSNGLDKRNPRSTSSFNFRSRGAIPDAMAIRRGLVRRGVSTGASLGHVLHLFLCETNSAAGFCHPMVGAEGDKNGWGAEGQRIAIAPSVDLTRRGLSPGGLVIARTLQQYGCYIGDNSGSSSALKAQQATRQRDPWQGLLRRDSLAGITWDDFVVLPKGWQ